MMKKIWKMLLGMIVLCVLVTCRCDNSYGKIKFANSRPLGMMATAVDDNVVLTWENVKKANGYYVYEALPGKKYRKVRRTSKCKVVLKGKNRGQTYRYYVKAYRTIQTGKSNGEDSDKKQKEKTTKIRMSKAGKKVAVTVAIKGKSTIKNLLQTAIAPIGSTMYVWGGGWNKADTAAGREARRVGLSATWRTFAKGKKASYNYLNYTYQIHDGLDCSGFVGWCIYNVMNTKNGKAGYVYKSSSQARIFAENGFGTYRDADEITDYKAGDIMSSSCGCCGHVWMVVGQCDDGSVVLVHSSPAGVQLSGTTTMSGEKNSQAYRLAKRYMKKYFKSWYKKYPDVGRNSSYLHHYGQMRWETKQASVYLSDPDGYQLMSAKEVLRDLFGKIN